MIIVQKFEGSLDGLADRIKQALSHFDDGTVMSDNFELVGPMPIFTLDPFRVARGATKLQAHPSGWRILVQSHGKPVALADIPLSAHGYQLSVSIRGNDPAEALASALAAAARYADDVKNYRLSIVNIPRLFITAIFLSGQRSVFFPTRSGTADRGGYAELTRRAFVKLVNLRLRQSLRSGLEMVSNGTIQEKPSTVGLLSMPNSPPKSKKDS